MSVGVKTLTVNWDSLPEMERVFNQIKSRIGELRIQQAISEPRKIRFRRLFESCSRIWESDISSVYADMGLSNDRKFYVYAHLDTSRKIASQKHPITTFAATLGMSAFPFYVGKGTGDRSGGTDRNETHRKVCQKIKMMGKEPVIIKIKDSLTESEALQHESKLIDIFGLLPHGGLLTNLDEGYRAKERRSFYREDFSALSRFNGEVLVPNLGNGRSLVAV